MKAFCHCLFLILNAFNLFGQSLNPSVIGSSGDYFQHSNSGNLSWTVGEITTETYENNFILTQGFQQFYLEITPVFEASEANFSFSVYPNPTPDRIIIETNQKGKFLLEFLDLTGKILLSREVALSPFEWSLPNCPEGIYYLKISREGRLVRTFKVKKAF